jgi:diguanylate cyclase (GGDEF)-like protein
MTNLARVLVVDDAQVMRRAVEKMLRGEYDVVLAEDGEAGWEALQRDAHIDILITDIQMPRLDGYGLICRARADRDPRIHGLPIITITAAEDDETRIRAYACGSTDFLTKPFDKQLLESRVHAYLRLKRASLLHSASDTQAANPVDALTGLSGLGAFIKTGTDYFQRAKAGGQDLSVTALDIDNFMVLQRQHGPAVTDPLLKQIAAGLTATVRKEDIVARVGKSEFAILIPHADRNRAMALCERLRERVADETATTAGGPMAVTASFGLVTLSADTPETFEKFLALVEQRLSQARSDGGNRVGVTLLADVMPPPEEVVLSGKAEEGVPEFNAAGEIEIDADAGDLSVEDLEALMRDEVARQRRNKAAGH